MAIYIKLSLLFVISLIDVPMMGVYGHDVVSNIAGVKPPGTIVKHKLQFIHPQTEKFSLLQTKLELLTDKVLHMAESVMTGAVDKLYPNSEEQTLITECRKFHKPIVCSGSSYHSVDGSCNNVKHPTWGKGATQQQRILPANYEGTHGLRKSKNGGDLPNARLISLSMTNFSNPSQTVSALFTFFGQFVAHDITETPTATINGKKAECCDETGTIKVDSFCADVRIPPTDPFYAQFNVTCQPVHRAAPYPSCNIGKRQIIDKKSSFIDASQTYDNTEERLKQLRVNDGTGRLRTQNSKHGELLPNNHDAKSGFCPVNGIQQCFEGGDARTNQHTMLMSLETIFVRLHNKIAGSLHKLNPNWDDDKIFHETRRILIALFQYIIYEEYLPWLIGHGNMDKFNLYPDFESGSQYDDRVDPSMLAEFSTAAFRVHSMVPTYFSSFNPKFKFRNTFSNVRPIYSGRHEALLAGTCELPSENNDEFQTEDMSDYLYKGPGETFGIDMTLTDVMRGREVGLPTYADMVHYCDGGLQLQDFSHLSSSGLMTQKNAQELAKIYKDVRDIDLLIGILRERRAEDAALGPTGSCIATIQFYRLKAGDSFFFTHTNGRNPFNREQLQIIRTYSLARIICETTKLQKIRKSPLLLPSQTNPFVFCNSFSPMDLTAWKE